MQLNFELNGQPVTLFVDGAMRALDLLRERCGITGPKEGCGSGECGACAIWIDGVTKLSCLMLAAQLQGRTVTTIEGLAKDEPHPLQQFFVKKGAVQCGYCTPGMIMTAAELLTHEKMPDREMIRNAISGNICRCTGYHKIVDAVEDAAEAMQGLKP
ncbi:CoxS [Desulforapulum autotrophicum HRM2]|uniref:CoxS n=1 Tax=Desulforapulum autotrophicum (strain ATCC 43914 / DSM 3382 / VKM B-1955 / HRM2) TaxID=177437 RepID=C0QAS5_DESAH|nr:(2Fe-2S)-binding protein [Desulforapulum autotrophicum]ACN16858.1 CoxS [Desulforapulum autotrophicum HRM2]